MTSITNTDSVSSKMRTSTPTKEGGQGDTFDMTAMSSVRSPGTKPVVSCRKSVLDTRKIKLVPKKEFSPADKVCIEHNKMLLITLTNQRIERAKKEKTSAILEQTVPIVTALEEKRKVISSIRKLISDVDELTQQTELLNSVAEDLHNVPEYVSGNQVENLCNTLELQQSQQVLESLHITTVEIERVQSHLEVTSKILDKMHSTTANQLSILKGIEAEVKELAISSKNVIQSSKFVREELPVVGSLVLRDLSLKIAQNDGKGCHEQETLVPSPSPL